MDGEEVAASLVSGMAARYGDKAVLRAWQMVPGHSYC
jgi:hypothetical protein